MCLGIPMRLTEIHDDSGTVESEGLEVEVSLLLIEQPAVGDYLLVHAGFAIERLDPERAQETLDLIRQMMPAVAEP